MLVHRGRRQMAVGESRRRCLRGALPRVAESSHVYDN